jgi:hypothetical protein
MERVVREQTRRRNNAIPEITLTTATTAGTKDTYQK